MLSTTQIKNNQQLLMSFSFYTVADFLPALSTTESVSDRC